MPREDQYGLPKIDKDKSICCKEINIDRYCSSQETVEARKELKTGTCSLFMEAGGWQGPDARDELELKQDSVPSKELDKVTHHEPRLPAKPWED